MQQTADVPNAAVRAEDEEATTGLQIGQSLLCGHHGTQRAQAGGLPTGLTPGGKRELQK